MTTIVAKYLSGQRARRLRGGRAASILALFFIGVFSSAPVPVRAQMLQEVYQRVLAVLRQPPATGVLVISLQLPPAALKAGLRPADVLTLVDGRPTPNAAALRQAVRAVAGNSHAILTVRAVRGSRILVLHAPPAALELSVLPVIAGAPAPLNPPATPRRRWRLHWRQVPTLQPQPGRVLGHDMWLLVFEHNLTCGSLHITISRLGRRWTLHWNLAALRGGPLVAQCWRIKFATARAPVARPFRLKKLQWRQPARTVVARDQGRELTGKVTQDGRTQAFHYPSVPGAVPVPALIAVAAAMPRRADVVLSLAELSDRTLSTRLGCALQTLGRVKTTIGGVKNRVWAVRALWLDIPQMTFFFAKDGALLKIKWGAHRTAVKVASPGVVRRVFSGDSLEQIPANTEQVASPPKR